MAIKQKIMPGDTYPVKFEARKPDPTNIHDSYGLPQTATSASVQLYDATGGAFIEIGGTGITTVFATVTAPTGSTSSDTGSVITYTLPSAFTAVPGDYVLFVTVTLVDGNKKTEDIRFKVNEWR